MARLRITALEGQHQGDVLEAQFNPKEISIDRTAVWQSVPIPGGPTPLQFLHEDPTHMAFELVFDGVKASASVQPHLDALQRLIGIDPALHHPPRVRVSLGTDAGGMPPFEAVVAAVSVKYLTFGPTGVPLRATASLKLEEAANLQVDRTRE